MPVVSSTKDTFKGTSPLSGEAVIEGDGAELEHEAEPLELPLSEELLEPDELLEPLSEELLPLELEALALIAIISESVPPFPSSAVNVTI